MPRTAAVAAVMAAGASLCAAFVNPIMSSPYSSSSFTRTYQAPSLSSTPFSSVCRSASAPSGTLSMVAAPPMKAAKLDKINILKLESRNLRDPLRSELATDEIFINHDAYQILKFHGSYQQDNRDNRRKGEEKDYSFMLRLKMPAGECTAELYRLLDDLSREYGHGHLRLTTRQTFQLHGVTKKNLKPVIKAIMDVGGSTVGGCGDVNRNIMTTPAPILNKPEYGYARQYTKIIAELLRPMSSAFTEMWLDGEKAASIEFWRKDVLDEMDVDAKMKADNGRGIVLNHPVEPLYGDLYLPRKFKIGITVPGDNSLDIYTNDIGLVVITNARGELEGFNVMVGGGMGRTHGKDTTFARAADHMGFVRKEDILEVTKAILAAQRDHGNREVRANARMKYLVHTLGIDRFRMLVESYVGKPIEPWREMVAWKYSDWLGWHDQGNGLLFYGMNIVQGRVIDRPGLRLKSVLRYLTDKYNFPMVCTPNQSLILKDIPAGLRPEIDAILLDHGVLPIESIDPLTRLAIACPALPMCGLAITEAERRMPEYIQRIRRLLDDEGLQQEEIMVRMTGCPNGCARPYMAELAFVGDGPQSYQVWVGGSPGNTHVGFVYEEKMKTDNMEDTMRPLLRAYKSNRINAPGTFFPEAFGDYCQRVGLQGLKRAVAVL